MKGIEQQWISNQVVHNGNVVKKRKAKATPKAKEKPVDANSEHIALF